MTLLTARALLPLQRYHDQRRGRLTYLPAHVYETIVRSVRALRW